MVIALKSANSFFFFLNLFRTGRGKKDPYIAYSMWHAGSVLDVYVNHYRIFTITTLWNTIIIIPIILFHREGTEAHADYVTCPKSDTRRALIWASEVSQPSQLQEFPRLRRQTQGPAPGMSSFDCFLQTYSSLEMIIVTLQCILL